MSTEQVKDIGHNISSELLLDMYERMRRIRRFEEKAVQLYRQGLIRGYLHPYIGQEAIAVGTCSAIGPDDYITSTHRGHGHCIGKGGDVRRMMAELFGKETGYCRGRGGSMHIANVDEGNLGANGIVGGGMPIAVGAALGNVTAGNDRVVVCYFSDGALSNGVFLESLNLASIWDLPVIFVLENNQWAVSTSVSYHCSAEPVSERARGYGMPVITADGNDVLEMYEVTIRAAERCRRREGPTFIEAQTYRRTGHHCNDPAKYYDPGVLRAWVDKDPINRLRNYLTAKSICSEDDLRNLDQRVDRDLTEAIQFAHNSPDPDVESFLREMEVTFHERMKIVS